MTNQPTPTIVGRLLQRRDQIDALAEWISAWTSEERDQRDLDNRIDTSGLTEAEIDEAFLRAERLIRQEAKR